MTPSEVGKTQPAEDGRELEQDELEQVNGGLLPAVRELRQAAVLPGSSAMPDPGTCLPQGLNFTKK